MTKKLFTIVAIILSLNSIAQITTIGLLYHDSSASDGYTLFTPEQSTSVFLINNCGELIHQWEFSENPGSTCYFLENGNLLRVGKDSIEIRDWDSNQLWAYATTDNGITAHHDIHPLPNGNVLCVASDIYTNAVIAEEGRDPSNTDATFKLDRIIELEPVGLNEANIVWEWKFIDHMIQDFDNTKENYGVVEDHPELLDLNFENGQTKDWTHINAVEYNQELDQILITARHLSEIYIIDHSTTMLEAAGHTGGNSSKGGDFIWRWGNPQVYRQGVAVDRKLTWPHDAKWVKSGYLDEGKISIFNNNFDGTGVESFVHLIFPAVDDYNYTMSENKFLPIDFDWSWNGEILGETMFAQRKSGAHSLPNGNFIICEYSTCIVSEITKSGELLWAYKNPVGETVSNQFQILGFVDVGIFRGEKYPPDYDGFDGKDLTPMGIIENTNANSEVCVSVDVETVLFEERPMILNSIISNSQIEFTTCIIADLIRVIGIDGKVHLTKSNFNSQLLHVNLKKGIYLVQFVNGKSIQTEKIIVQ